MLRHDLKRKRRDVAAGRVIKVYSASSRPTKRKRFTPGVDRTGGYYGRYAGPNAELKFHDVDLDKATTVITTAGIVEPTVIIIPQGVEENKRVGRKCTLKSINWKYRLNLPIVASAGSGVTSDTVRLMIIHDKQCNGATATVAGILESANYQSFRNLANSGRFNVLMDKTISLNYLGGAGDGAANDFNEVTKSGSFYKACNIPIEYDNSADTGVLTTIRSSNIGVLLISESAVVVLDSKFRFRFSDR